MSDIFFEEMDIPKPHVNLNVNSLGHGAMTGQMIERIEQVLLDEQPDWVLVYGDTNSTFAGAMAARKLHIKVAHVEAGLRSFNMKMPEEVNRILTDRISDILFCPTETAVENLKKEGYDYIGSKIVNCGDVMQDAAIFYSANAKEIEKPLPQKFILATIHRAENTDSAQLLKGIFSALEQISGELTVVLPLHPRTKSKLQNMGHDFENSKIMYIPPASYFEMIYLLKNCQMVMTDSGGVQKEAYFFEKPCITLREETEWVELIKNGFNILAGSNPQRIMDTFNKVKSTKSYDFTNKLYGHGNAGEIILKELLDFNK